MYFAKARFCLLLACVVLSIAEVCAQRPFRGRIVYNITYAGSMIDLAELQELPNQAVISVNENMVRTEMTGTNASLNQVQIANAAIGEISTIVELLRGTYVITRSATQIQTALRNMPQPELEFTSETKEILGFTARRVIARVVDDMGVEHVSNIFYTDQISGAPFNFSGPYNQIPGLMLEYEMRVGPLNIRFEAQSVSRRWFVGRRNFRIPKDYERITFEELRLRLQGS